jgi:hypothetical protein
MNASEFRQEVVDPLLAEAELDPLLFRRVFSLIAAIDSWAAHIY